MERIIDISNNSNNVEKKEKLELLEVRKENEVISFEDVNYDVKRVFSVLLESYIEKIILLDNNIILIITAYNNEKDVWYVDKPEEIEYVFKVKFEDKILDIYNSCNTNSFSTSYEDGYECGYDAY